MADYIPAAFKGDAAIPHADENNFICWIGGLWGLVGLHYARDIFTAKRMYTPDYVLAVTEERRRMMCMKKGVPFKSIAQLRQEKNPERAQQERLWRKERLLP
mmetsp:Transcript_28540/g.39421  ORF Transcript_28540/g.39421 Transcript_28540/m.39421 type:complete len:102 (+) Transcript_28540:252-557(+)|eukprot:CAMPEP_0196581426 /NCGR_PEP_ID=MMETSP1081-20130531/33951_1 /TAXON_ID=36882 /ORGANISM="Pyramimonas amylifera, Strain CCMP720" /LENGTH=101 /DNA_ID=CAMNT_0041901653 /DNA_START=248 /DNA_END=553 /DNA_ORIENTATION=-